jgi:glycosyltransferase involved in cell wall biosynthesis
MLIDVHVHTPGKTGLVVRANDSEDLLTALRALIGDPGRMREMARAARKSMEARSFESAFLKTWQLYAREHPQSLTEAQMGF